MFTDLINEYHFSATQLNSAIIIFNILFSFALSLVISWTWKKTHTELSYSRSFIFTMIMICILASVIMMVVRNNIVGAITIFGALSIVRFRTILKETRDIAFVLYALITGFAVGSSNYSIAILMVILISAIIFALHKYQWDITLEPSGFILAITVTKEFDISQIKNLLEDQFDSYEILSSRFEGDGLSREIIISSTFNDKSTVDFLGRELSNIPTILSVNLSSVAYPIRH